MNPYFTDYSEYISRIFPDIKIQKISINAGFSCPNRDGTIGTGGCIYCDNRTFSPSYCHESKSIEDQIEEGIRFFSRKYRQMQYLAYFQNFTGTYGNQNKILENYAKALSFPEIRGIIIGTRPDCINQNLLDDIKFLCRDKHAIFEFGIETTHNTTLATINRGHSWEEAKEGIRLTASAGFDCGAHLICGLPGENREMILSSVKKICRLPLSSLKFHQLQIIRGTRLHELWLKKEIDIPCLSIEEYADLCMDIIDIVPRDIAIERFVASSPPETLVSPKWGMKNYEFMNLLMKKLKVRDSLRKTQ